MGKVAKLPNQNPAHDTTHEERPWGSFEVIKSEKHFKAKVMQLRSGQQISYQSHAKREEHWVITQGTGLVIINEQNTIVKKGQYVHVPLGAKHRIRNTGMDVLEFVEVQLGSYFGEDDIVRFEDDYKRK